MGLKRKKNIYISQKQHQVSKIHVLWGITSVSTDELPVNMAPKPL